MKTALLIMAAGIGSRYGGGIKQLQPVGPNGELIIDYSIHDAIRAGFSKIIFVIRRDIEADFREAIGNRIEKVCRAAQVEVCYAYQALDDLPDGRTVPEGRAKPWGTGQAVLAARDVIREPFAVINADDYYGPEAYEKLHAWLDANDPEDASALAMAGFILRNTLSEHGTVTRGLCEADSRGFLTRVTETGGLGWTADGGVAAAGVPVDPDTPVSMNMWAMPPAFVRVLEEGFRAFLAEKGSELKAEYLLPVLIGGLLQAGRVSVQVLPIGGKWFGVTYKEDHPLVVDALRRLIADGVYREDLFSDL